MGMCIVGQGVRGQVGAWAASREIGGCSESSHSNSHKHACMMSHCCAPLHMPRAVAPTPRAYRLRVAAELHVFKLRPHQC
jgi:hypothetical protein